MIAAHTIVEGAADLERLSQGEVHLWLLEPALLQGLGGSAELLLPEEDLWKAARIPSGSLREQWRSRRSALRALLAQYSRCSPQELPLDTDALGKPVLRGGPPGLHFSVSASQGWWLAAVASEPVGVDLELPDLGLDWRVIAERYFSSEERELLGSVDGEAGLKRFYRFWTRKEAWLKLRGVGLAGLEFLKEEPLQGGWIEDLPMEPGLVAALAMDRAPVVLKRCGSGVEARPLKEA